MKQSSWKQARGLLTRDPVLRVLLWGGLTCLAVVALLLLAIQ